MFLLEPFAKPKSYKTKQTIKFEMFRFKAVVERGIKTDFCLSTIVEFNEF